MGRGFGDLNNSFIYTAKNQKMSNRSSEVDPMSSEEESQEMIPGKKYIKKPKANKKKAPKIISSTYKKKRCEFYNKGACKKGSQCPFSHSFIPDVAKKICKFFLSDSCTKGDECPYSHNTKRYPCKFFHIQQNCGLGAECRFSHQEIDNEFQQEFLKDNEDFLLKIFKQERLMPEKFINYIRNNDLLNKQNKKGSQPAKPVINLPFIFGMQSYKPAPREEKPSEEAAPQTRRPYVLKKNSNIQQPFSIRLIHKNRTFIPQRLNEANNQNEGQRENQSENAQSPKSFAQSQKNQLQCLGSQKLSQGIDLTPESKTQRYYQGIQYYMCSQN